MHLQFTIKGNTFTPNSEYLLAEFGKIIEQDNFNQQVDKLHGKKYENKVCLHYSFDNRFNNIGVPCY
jgi:hypothetical protein